MKDGFLVSEANGVFLSQVCKRLCKRLRCEAWIFICEHSPKPSAKESSLYFAEVRRMSADEVCELFTRKNICLASQRAESTYILERVFSRFLLK